MPDARPDDRVGPDDFGGERFRRDAHALVDWIVDYYARVAELPVRSPLAPGAVRAALPEAPPTDPEPFAAQLADLDRIVVPALTHWQSPRFFGYFPANNSAPSILGELAAAALGVQGMMWITSPACTELETHVLDWLADACALPAAFKSSGPGGGVIQDSASSGLLCALIAARERATGGRANEHGCREELVAYGTEEAHSSLLKGVMIAGIGRANLRRIPTGPDRGMDPEALARAIAADRAAGRIPFFVCATVGTTSSLAVDPVRAIGERCRAEGLWLHVDAALAGSAALCPEWRGAFDGLELADSYCFNPHKWLLTNFDCSCLYVADRRALSAALSVTPEYLRNEASSALDVIDYRDWQVPLGRRFRALKLWFVIRSHGIAGLQAHLRRHVRLAAWFAGQLAEDPRFEIVAPVWLNLVCFRLRAPDDANARLHATLNDSGEVFLSHTVLDGRYALRLCVGQAQTRQEHVEAALEAIRRAAAGTLGSSAAGD